jgi:hypothetical protein
MCVRLGGWNAESLHSNGGAGSVAYARNTSAISQTRLRIATDNSA